MSSRENFCPYRVGGKCNLTEEGNCPGDINSQTAEKCAKKDLGIGKRRHYSTNYPAQNLAKSRSRNRY